MVTLTFQDNSTVTGGTLSIGNSGKVEIATAASATWDDVTVHNGAGTSPAGHIQVDGTLHVNGSTAISGGALGIGGTFDSKGTDTIDSVAITNSGTFEVTAGTTTIDAASSVTNTGTFEVNGGNLILEGTLTGNATIVGASLLELSASSTAYSSANVTFAAGATGTLQLDQAKTFGGTGGTVTGFTVSGLDDNTLDLRDIGYGNNLTVSYAGNTSGGTLSIFVSGVDVSDIKLTGDYTGVHWALANDGSSQHGTDVTEIPGAITAGLDANGNAVEGNAVTASITDGGQAVTGATYQWQRDGTDIATGASYLPTESDEGHVLTVNVSYVDALGNPETSSASAGTVAESPTENATIALTGLTGGNAVESQKITANVTDPDAPTGSGATFTYTWTVGGKIVGDSSNTYTPTEADEGKAIGVSVSVRRHGGGEPERECRDYAERRRGRRPADHGEPARRTGCAGQRHHLYVEGRRHHGSHRPRRGGQQLHTDRGRRRRRADGVGVVHRHPRQSRDRHDVRRHGGGEPERECGDHAERRRGRRPADHREPAR